ncbi:hypothetical protein DFA_10528 [Cavenderia fasciculata]|uniref:LRAT domain-containing protein n=1 Tax=Cavenderia fasciculata TaxID=261658 RepID=F4QAG7_CACFS|nr:uncharacterized protein DFA_10528 [Cavenderia fasciculata]EGG15686.1 hypothetical protein DFA_10528 [Cavenderia fasciculata]|eukprot:XP_004354428.1 hypothetical protein DFA_10528 [Cavenderia fasciculata]
MTPQFENGTRFQPGDIVFGIRYLFGLLVYYHAGVVLETDSQGRIIRAIHWDPAFDQQQGVLTIDRYIFGYDAPPVMLETVEAVERIFQPGHTRIGKRRGGDPIDIAQLLLRAEQAIIDGNRTYILFFNNCQHFAHYLVYQEHHSPDAEKGIESIRKGFQIATRVTGYVLDDLVPSIKVQPFGNFIVRAFILLLINLILVDGFRSIIRWCRPVGLPS